MSRYSPTERIGVNAAENIVIRKLGWIFREQIIVDMGIDAQIERVDDGNPTGKLIAVQIKTGLSHFKEKSESFVYYGKTEHLDYWSGHSLPVILVAHLPDRNLTLWAHITESSVRRTATAWKIHIPKNNVLGEDSLSELARIFEGPPSQQKFRKLAMDEPLMRHIQNGGKVSLELEKWINKSLGRTPVQVFIHDEDGNETLSKEWFQYYTGYSIKSLAEALFPWAEASLDEEFFEQNSEAEDYYDASYWDTYEEDRQTIPRRDPNYIPPYKEAACEVEYYRLKLSLNQLGESFLIVSDHLET